MIQRIQTIYLFIVTLISGTASFLIPEWDFSLIKLNIAYHPVFAAYGYLIIAVIALITLFLFKNRKRQMALTRLNVLLNIALLGFFVYWFLNLPGENNATAIFSKNGIGMLGPVISIVFLRLAYRAIKKDEDLVKSVDRLR